MATETGTKDKYFQYFVEDLQNKLNKWRDSHKGDAETSATASSTRAEQQREFLKKIREDFPKNLFNPVLDIPGKCLLTCQTSDENRTEA